jgi:hypothetical protein
MVFPRRLILLLCTKFLPHLLFFYLSDHHLIVVLQEIEQSKRLLDSIIQSKDNLIAALKGQLEDKDHQYMAALHSQRQDIGFNSQVFLTSYLSRFF